MFVQFGVWLQFLVLIKLNIYYRSVPKRPMAYIEEPQSLIKCKEIHSMTKGSQVATNPAHFLYSLALNSCNMFPIWTQHWNKRSVPETQLQIDSIYHMSLITKLQDKPPIYIKHIHMNQQCAFTLTSNQIIWVFNWIIIPF